MEHTTKRKFNLKEKIINLYIKERAKRNAQREEGKMRGNLL